MYSREFRPRSVGLVTLAMLVFLLTLMGCLPKRLAEKNSNSDALTSAVDGSDASSDQQMDNTNSPDLESDAKSIDQQATADTQLDTASSEDLIADSSVADGVADVHSQNDATDVAAGNDVSNVSDLQTVADALDSEQDLDTGSTSDAAPVDTVMLQDLQTDSDTSEIKQPVVTIFTLKPARVTTRTDPVFEWTCNQPPCTSRCQLNGGGWDDCQSGLYLVASSGTHTLEVQSTNGFGDKEQPPKKLTFSLVSWKQVTLGTLHSCAIISDGTLWCWGDNRWAQTGNDQVTPAILDKKQVGQESDWIYVSAGGVHTCGIRSDNDVRTLWCWGANDQGQLGLTHTGSPVSSPKKVGDWTDWKYVRAMTRRTCGIRDDNSLWCWGKNEFGELGIGSKGDTAVTELTMVGLAKDWKEIAGGDWHTCGLKTDGTIWCWGTNANGEIGQLQPTTESLSPLQVGSGKLWTVLTAGLSHTCGIFDDALWCFGYNYDGQTADSTSEKIFGPTLQPSPASWLSVVAGENHSCGVASDATLWCWGDNSYSNQLGFQTAGTSKPNNVEASTYWERLVVGRWHTCGMKGKSLWCWGSNSAGMLGLGHSKKVETPQLMHLEAE